MVDLTILKDTSITGYKKTILLGFFLSMLNTLTAQESDSEEVVAATGKK